MTTSEIFRTELLARLDRAEKRGARSIKVNSGDLHRSVGGYPGPNHQTPTCCEVMCDEMTDGDVIVDKPPSGKGARLTIRYRLPRSGRQPDGVS